MKKVAMGVASFALYPKKSFFFISPLFTFKVERYTKEKNDLMGFYFLDFSAYYSKKPTT
jgi:hypothetical protein